MDVLIAFIAFAAAFLGALLGALWGINYGQSHPLQEPANDELGGYVNKGGHNTNFQFDERPDPPAPFQPGVNETIDRETARKLLQTGEARVGKDSIWS